MNTYRSYMDRIEVSNTLHARLMECGCGARRPRRESLLMRCGGMAACLALICLAGWGVFRLNTPRTGGDITPPPAAAASPAVTDTPQRVHPFYDSEPSPTSPPIALDVTPINFEGGMELCASIAMPDGWFEEALTRNQIAALLGGGDEVPAALSWGGYDVTGRAVYDGTGKLWRVILWGVERADGENSFTMTLRPGAIPEDCVVENTQATVLNGVTVNGSKGQYSLDSSDTMGEVRKLTFMAGDLGVAFQVSNRDGWQAEFLASLAANCYAGEGDTPLTLTLAGLDPYDGEIPEWISENVTLAEARAVEELGRYVPVILPDGFPFESAWRELGRNRDYLSLSWSKGYDYINVTIYGAGLYQKADSDAEPIPIADLSPEVVADQLTYVDTDSGDVAGYRGRFAAAYPDGVTAEYSVKGVNPEDVYWLLQHPQTQPNQIVTND